ncbi:c-type cytochrome [Aquisediminimonas profunda]|uniref:c-type cytochrome n=1 Tax=Aquisediminimonas profunda TaxID=1550733 RepID=UPI001C6260DA|nr:cytochrome c family protein [Aquisediminimonas profunda]
MRKFNLVLPLAVCATALITLSACSTAPTDESQSADSNTATETASAPEAATTNAATPATSAAPVSFASLTGDATKGQKIFMQCMACHSIKEGENKVGPSLHGVIGRTAGSVANFSYSTANKSSGITWTKEKLFDYLAAPQKMVPGTKMAFPGLPVAQDRADVIAYIDAND